MPISVGSVEVDVIPNTRGIYGRLQSAIVPAAARVGDEAGRAAGNRLGDAMVRAVDPEVGARIGQQIGQQIAARIQASIRDGLRDGVTQGGRQARASAVRQGDDTGGAFSRALKTRLEAAFRSLPQLQVGADTSEADADLQALRVRMESLSRQRIGIDISAEDARAEIRLIEAELQRLGAQHPNVQVRADTASALAQLAAVRAAIDEVDRDEANVRVDTSGAVSALLRLSVALLAVPAIPAIPVIAAGLGSITAAAAAAAVGLGALAAVAVPAVLDMAEALQAQKTAQDAATTATAKGGQTAAQAAQRSLRLQAAVEAVAAAEESGARQVEQAQERVRDARQAVADAAQRAALRQQQAVRAVRDAERSLADAQDAARQAQLGLTAARRAAAQELADLDSRLANARLSQRDAELALAEAAAERNRVLADASASDLDRQRAILAYDQAVQRLRDQTVETRRLRDETAAAHRAGVDGSETVRSAQERLADAQRQVADRARAVRDAQAEAARVQVATARQVADAQERVGEATRSVAVAQESAARAVASAQRQVASAQLATAGAADQAAVAQAKYQAALDKLSPTARDTFDAFVSLRDAFRSWSQELQPRVMPLFTRALGGLRRALPGLTPLALAAADAVGELQDRAARGLRRPWWREFRRDLAGSVEPAIVGLGTAFGNVFKGMAGVVQAFLPHMDSISATMQRITARFANWGTSLKGSPEFERFLAYSAEQGPIIAATLGDIGRAFFEVAQSLEPLSGPILEVLGAVARAIASIADTLPWLIKGMYLAYVATKVWTLAMIVFNAVVDANPLVLLTLAIIAVVAAVVYAYKRWGWFRAAVQAAWDGIRRATEFVWERVLRPAFDAIVQAIQAVGDAATWLWREAIEPAFRFIWTAARVLLAIVLVAVFGPLILGFKAVGAIATWLWKKAVGPAFRAIGAVAEWLWRKAIKPAFDGIRIVIVWWWRNVVTRYFNLVKLAIRALGTAFRWLRDRIVRPVFGTIRSTINTAWTQGLRPAFSKISDGVALVGDAFEKARDAIKKAWEKIDDITKKPVNFVIKWVYTRGLKAVWDKVASFVGLDKLPKAPKLLAAGGTVGPGWGPAAPMVTNRPTAIVGEGNPRHPEFVIPTDPRYRPRARALWEAAGTQLLAGGGILGGAWDWTKDVAGKAWDWAKTGADLMVHPGKVWDKLVGPVRDKIREIGSSRWAKMVARIPTKMISGLKDKLVGAVTSFLGSGVDGWVGDWLNPVPGGRRGTPFGKRGPMWASGYHTGLDIVAPTGTPVRAVADGSITRATSGGSYGKHIEISHGGNLSSLYAHLSDIDADFGYPVRAGQMIGRVGATGNVTGPHLHLEARRGPRAVDPLPYLQGKVTGLASKSPEAAQRYARSLLSNYGWGRDQWPPLKKLWQAESGWRWDATNPTSGAYGIPQSLPGWKMAAVGRDWRTNPATQIKWGLGYIRARPDYGSPAQAWAMWQSRSPHWYDSGGYLPEGLSLAYNGTGRPEAVLTASQERALLSIAADRATGSPGLGDLSVHVYVGDREITDIARTEVRAETGRLISTIRAR